MYEFAVSVIILVLLVLIGVETYYIYDYYNYKKEVAKDMDAQKKQVNTDRNSVKDVVRQLNNVHSDMDNRFGMNEQDINKNQGGIKKNNASIQNIRYEKDIITSGIDKVVQFYDQANQKLSLNDLFGASSPDMKLLSHVTSVGGMTINDLDKAAGSAKRLKICGTSSGDKSHCIEIPDDDGNIRFSPLYDNTGIALNGPTSVNAPLAFANDGKLGAVISALDSNTGFIQTDSLGVGKVISPPTASVHIMAASAGANTPAPLKVTVDGSDVVSVDKYGKVTANSIEIKQGNSTILSVNDTGITLNAPNVNITGNVNVNGVAYTSSSVGTSASTSTSGGTSTITSSSTPAPSSTVTTDTTTTAPAPTPTTGIISPFISGPVVMGKINPYKPLETPVDFMNSPYLIPVQ